MFTQRRSLRHLSGKKQWHQRHIFHYSQLVASTRQNSGIRDISTTTYGQWHLPGKNSGIRNTSTTIYSSWHLSLTHPPLLTASGIQRTKQRYQETHHWYLQLVASSNQNSGIKNHTTAITYNYSSVIQRANSGIKKHTTDTYSKWHLAEKVASRDTPPLLTTSGIKSVQGKIVALYSYLQLVASIGDINYAERHSNTTYSSVEIELL